MAIVVRTRRFNQTEGGCTPSGLGPGAYNPDVDRRNEQSHAPFSSTSSRVVAINPMEDSLYTPGPGTYDKESSLIRRDASSTAFVSRTNRFSNHETGTPGPGTYTPPKVIGSKRTYAPPTDESQEGLYRHPGAASLKNPTPPSIPVPNQSFGYEQAPNGALVQQRPPEKGHRGRDNDTVGPGEYDPRDYYTAAVGRSTDFGKSPGERLQFMNKNTPAPGEYERTGSSPQRMQQSSAFKSKVPTASQRSQSEPTPGPGSYEYSNPLNNKLQRSYDSIQFFGSTVKRAYEVDPANYSAPFSMKTPGPGSYAADSRTALFRSSTIPVEKKPFNSSGTRFNDPLSMGTPGPGAYKSEVATSLVHDIQKKVTGTKGAFGTVSKRNTGSFLDHKPDAAEGKPGPGSYDAQLPTGKSPNRRKNIMNSVFASNQNRFVQSAPAALEVPPPGAYSVADSWTYDQRKPYRQSDVFISTSERFAARDAAPGVPKKVGPGPGAYKEADGTGTEGSRWPKKAMSVFVSKDKRYVLPKPIAPGPGAYQPNVPTGTFVKRSFNVTIDPVKDTR